MSTLIKLDHINKDYYLGQQRIQALRDIQFELQRGELAAIVGASGSGKSTLMNIIGMLDQCSSGTYFFSDQDVSRLKEDQLADIRNHRIGFIFQSFCLLPRSSALQNVMLPLFYRRIPDVEANEKAMTVLAKLGIAHLAHHKPNQLSGGQQQRVAIARALVGDPDVLLADEPTGALDSQTGSDIMRLFLELHQNEGRTILIITHDAAISRQCNRVVTIKDGTLFS